MTSFKEKIEEAEKSHAYLKGAEAFSKNITCPYDPESPEGIDWYNGYKDAEFLYRLIHEQ